MQPIDYFAGAVNQFLQDPNVIYSIADFDDIASALLVGFSRVAPGCLAAASRSSRRPTSLQISFRRLLLRCLKKCSQNHIRHYAFYSCMAAQSSAAQSLGHRGYSIPEGLSRRRGLSRSRGLGWAESGLFRAGAWAGLKGSGFAMALDCAAWLARGYSWYSIPGGVRQRGMVVFQCFRVARCWTWTGFRT